MKIVIFGLSVSSSWGNGHATLWRGLFRELDRRGHTVVFFERDAPYYAGHRDPYQIPGGELILYNSWPEVMHLATAHMSDAEVGIVTSYCPDSLDAAALLHQSRALRVFYDLDTGVTLTRLECGEPVDYIDPDRGLRDYDLVLSYTGGQALDLLRSRLGARAVAPLYGSVDPEAHHPANPNPDYTCDLSYLGTYAADRQEALERLFIAPARQYPQYKFLIGGSQYPQDFPWTSNIYFARHVAPDQHPAFYSSSRLTLNVTRGAMARLGYCPSGRLFEAAACGVPVVSDVWEGLDQFYEPQREILFCASEDDTLEALGMSGDALKQVGARARQRTLDCHTSAHRANELEAILSNAKGDAYVGNHSSSRSGEPYSAPRIFQGTVARGQSTDR